MALLCVSLVLGFSGCRQAPPPAFTQGWASLAQLAAHHPLQTMLVSYDQRLATLRSEYHQLAGGTTGVLPPGAISLYLPALGALTAAADGPGPARPYTALAATDLAALQQQLTHERNRQYPRSAREVRAAWQQEFAAAMLKFERDADAQRREIDLQYRTPLLRLELGYETARQFVEQNPQYPEAKEHLAQRKQHWDAMKGEYHATLTTLETALAKQRNTLTAQAEKTLAGRLQQLHQQFDARIVEEIAAAKTRLDAEAARARAADPVSGMQFDAEAAVTQTVRNPQVVAGFQQEQGSTAVTRQQRLATLTSTLETLRQERDALAETITDDTRAAAEAVATEHGHQLSFTRNAGSDITPQVEKWLAGYWH